MPDTAALAIREVCAHSGLSARTVRYYEELGLLPGVRRRSLRAGGSTARTSSNGSGSSRG